MVEELPVEVSSVETDEERVFTDENTVAVSGISTVLLRAKQQADVLVERSLKGDEINGGVAATQAAVSLIKDELRK